MRSFYFYTILFVLSLFAVSNYTYSQTSIDSSKTSAVISDTARITTEVGKIYTKAEADSLYGPVLTADTIKTAVLTQLTVKTPKYMMFNSVEGKATILNSSRMVISGAAQTIKPEQELRFIKHQ